MSMSTTLGGPQLYHLSAGVEDAGNDGLFSSGNPRMTRIHEHLGRFAAVNIPDLFLGESGVGKEVYARRIHRLSPRGHRTLLKINCAALPSELLESELFGYEAGAFTGAVKGKPGVFVNSRTLLRNFWYSMTKIPPSLSW